MSLTVASWNVLAQAYIRPERYRGCDAAALKSGGRLRKISEQIDGLRADVVCLQEAEKWFSERPPRPEFSTALAMKQGGKPDGCAIQVARPALMEAHETLGYSDGSGHIALVSFVASSIGRVAVATTHLKWDPPETPAGERFALKETGEVLDWLRRRAAGIPWIVCGDFNVTSDDAVIARFAAAGLRDSYAALPGAATCVANGRARRIDFMLYTGDLMATPRPLPPLADDACLPSAEMPSDHLPIAATFERLG